MAINVAEITSVLKQEIAGFARDRVELLDKQFAMAAGDGGSNVAVDVRTRREQG